MNTAEGTTGNACLQLPPAPTLYRGKEERNSGVTHQETGPLKTEGSKGVSGTMVLRSRAVEPLQGRLSKHTPHMLLLFPASLSHPTPLNHIPGQGTHPAPHASEDAKCQ